MACEGVSWGMVLPALLQPSDEGGMLITGVILPLPRSLPACG